MAENKTISEFVRLASKSDQVRQKYAGLVVDNLEIEVGNMLRHTMERANELSFRSSPTKNGVSGRELHVYADARKNGIHGRHLYLVGSNVR